ncbi:MAG: penicillin-binding transpeptidase domain-containing protein, partial [Spirochaetota bacterium]
SMLFDSTEQDAMRQVTKETYLQRRQVSQRTNVEGALVTLENDTGHILAMVGGSPFESGNQNNRAINARRPPGSSFKPLYYAAAVDTQTISPATVFMDSPVVFWNNDGTPYIPENYNGEWNGPTRTRYALATSMNVVSLKILDAVGFTDALGTAGRLLGLNETQMAERRFEPRYPVGLGTVSVSPLLMAKAFATFPNGGREVVPISIRYIEDRRGNTILSPAQDVAQELVRKGRQAQIISPQAAYIMTDMLQSTVEYGTLRNRRLLVGGFDDMPMAGKTGTTQNWSDAWTVGFSPYMTTAVWLGFDRGGSNSLGTNQTGAQTAGPIWARYMKDIHQDLPTREFERPNGIVEVTVSAKTGRLPTEDYRGETVEEIFIAGSRTIPTEFDDSEDFHNERRTRLATELSRPTAVTPSVALRDRIFASGILDSTEPDDAEGEDAEDEDERRSTERFGTGANPFFDDPGDPSPDAPESEDEDEDQGLNESPFSQPSEREDGDASDEPGEDESVPTETPDAERDETDASEEEPERNPMLD